MPSTMIDAARGMTERSDPSLFSVDDRPGEWVIQFRVEGTVSFTINAEDENAAKAAAAAMLEDDDQLSSLDDVTDAAVDSVRAMRPMFRVMRGERAIQTSHLMPGDLPRDPAESGF